MTHEEFNQKFAVTAHQYSLGALVGEDSIIMLGLHKENKDDETVSCNMFVSGNPVELSHALYDCMQKDAKLKTIILGAAVIDALKSKI